MGFVFKLGSKGLAKGWSEKADEIKREIDIEPKKLIAFNEEVKLDMQKLLVSFKKEYDAVLQEFETNASLHSTRHLIEEASVTKMLELIAQNANAWSAESHHECLKIIRDSALQLYQDWRLILSEDSMTADHKLSTLFDRGIARIKMMIAMMNESEEIDREVLEELHQLAKFIAS